ADLGRSRRRAPGHGVRRHADPGGRVCPHGSPPTDAPRARSRRRPPAGGRSTDAGGDRPPRAVGGGRGALEGGRRALALAGAGARYAFSDSLRFGADELIEPGLSRLLVRMLMSCSESLLTAKLRPPFALVFDWRSFTWTFFAFFLVAMGRSLIGGQVDVD